MRKKFCMCLLSLCLLLTACAPAAQPEADPVPEPDPAPAEAVSTPEEIPTPAEPELSERDQNWITDIRYLQSNFKTRHLAPFYVCPEEEFDRKIDQLCERVNGLSDNDICFELKAIIAGMGDIHSYMFLPESVYESLFPFSIQYFDGRMYLSCYMEGYEQFEPYLLREIVAVNGVDISYLEGKFASIIDPYNAWYSKARTSGSFVPAFFDWAGCGYQEGYTFQILDENQQVQSIEVPVVPYAEYAAAQWVYPASQTAGSQGNQAEYCEGKNGGYVYIDLSGVQVADAPHYRELFENVAGLMEAYPECRKLAIDLRRNPGGNSIALDYLQEDVQILKELSIDQTYVLTGGFSTSAATVCLTLFKEELNAVTVGEPTGQFTSFFCPTTTGPAHEVVLPLSNLTVSVSGYWWEGDDFEGTAYDENGKLYEWETTILPDVYVHQDIDDSREGRDTVLKWVLAQ